VYWHGAGRSTRLARFARRRDGDVSPHDGFDLRERAADLYSDDVHIGYSARLEATCESPVYLYELHPEPQGRARSTAALLERDRPRFDGPLTIRARVPSGDAGRGFADRFAVDGPDPDDLPDPLVSLLSDRVDDLGWLPEVRLSNERLVVGSRERVLATDDEWNELLELTTDVVRALENRE